METNMDAENNLLSGRQGRLDALKFIDEQATVSSVTGPGRDHTQNAYQMIVENDLKLTSHQISAAHSAAQIG